MKNALRPAVWTLPMNRHLLALIVWSLFPLIAAVQGPPTCHQDIRPLLRTHCTICHSIKNLGEIDTSAGPALDALEAIRKGGRVPIIDTTAPEKSLLLTLLPPNNPANRRLPLDAEPLAPMTMELVRLACRSMDIDVLTGADKTIRVWNAATGRAIRTLATGSGMNAVAGTADDKRIASGGFDGVFRLWDARGGRLLASFVAPPPSAREADRLILTPKEKVAASPNLRARADRRLFGETPVPQPLTDGLHQPTLITQVLRAGKVIEAVFATPKP